MIGMMGIAEYPEHGRRAQPILRESERSRCRGAIYCAPRYTGAFGGRDENRALTLQITNGKNNCAGPVDADASVPSPAGEFPAPANGCNACAYGVFRSPPCTDLAPHWHDPPSVPELFGAS